MTAVSTIFLVLIARLVATLVAVGLGWRRREAEYN